MLIGAGAAGGAGVFEPPTKVVQGPVAFPLAIAIVLLLSAYASLVGVGATPSLVALVAAASSATIKSAVDSFRELTG